jgi:hypothetical protein
MDHIQIGPGVTNVLRMYCCEVETYGPTYRSGEEESKAEGNCTVALVI